MLRIIFTCRRQNNKCEEEKQVRFQQKKKTMKNKQISGRQPHKVQIENCVT
jgi:hypothetical protein